MKYHITNIRILSLLLVLIFIIGAISGCGRNDKSGTSPQENAAELHYQATEIPIPADFTPYQARFLDNEIFLSDYQTIIKIDYKGNELHKISFPEDMPVVALDFLPDGSFWGIAPHYSMDETSIHGYTLDKISFIRFSNEGNELERIEAAGSQFADDEEFVYIRGMMVAGDYFYLKTYYEVYVVDKSGQKIMKLNNEGKTPKGGEGSFRSLFRLKDGRIAAASMIFNSRTYEHVYLIQIPDPEKKEAEEISIPASEFENSFTTGKDADFLFLTGNGFFDVNLENSEQNLVFDNLRNGIMVRNISEINILSDGAIVIAELSAEQYINRLVRFNLVEAGADVSGTNKQVIVLAGIYIEEWLKAAVVDFNKSNSRFFVEIKDYTENGIIEEEDAITRFNIDLTTGNFPDIIMLYLRMPSSHYVNKDIFADLNPFMDNDPGFNRADYLPGLFEAMDRNGEIFEIFPMFMLQVLIGKTSDLGFDRGWTLEEFSDFIWAKPGSRYIIDSWTKRHFIGSLVQNYFVNPLTGECFFDRDIFKKILEVAERFPQNEVDFADYGELYEGLGTGDTILKQDFISHFTHIKSLEYFWFNEETTIKGFPSPDGNGLYFSPLNFFGIATGARNPVGAWEFIKFAMDNSKCPFGGSLSVNLRNIEEMMEKQKREFEDGGGMMGGSIGEIKYSADFEDMGELSERNISQIMDALMETRLIRRRNPVISNIIMEEIDSYLSGQKTADTVADIIENRIGIYLAELE